MRTVWQKCLCNEYRDLEPIFGQNDKSSIFRTSAIVEVVILTKAMSLEQNPNDGIAFQILEAKNVTDKCDPL